MASWREYFFELLNVSSKDHNSEINNNDNNKPEKKKSRNKKTETELRDDLGKIEGC